MRAQSYQTVAHGADTIQFFQLRRSVGACEKFHGAVIAHVGHENTRVFREVAQLGKELKELDCILGSDNPSKVGIIFDWDNYWALEYTSGPHKDLKYVDQIHSYYRYFYDKNIPVDMIPIDADFSKYDVVVAPVLYGKGRSRGSLRGICEKGRNPGNQLYERYCGSIRQRSPWGYPGPSAGWLASG